MMPSLDAAAIAAFTDEFRLSLPAIRLAMEHARQNRVDLAQAREAHRLIHSLKGAASMVGLAAFGYLLNELETHIEQAIAAKAPLGDNTFELTAYTLPRLQGYMDALLARQSVEPMGRELLAGFGRSAEGDLQVLWELIEIEAREIALPPIEPETTPAALPRVVAAPDALAELPLAPTPAPVLEPGFEVVPSTPVPPELAEIFSLEAQEHLDTIAKVTAALSPEQQDSAAVQELRRSVHTLKGAAGVVGYIGASKLAHRMEDLLDRLYEGTATLTAPAVRTLASSSDALHDMIGGSQEVEKLQAMVLRLFSEYDRLMGDVPAMPAGSAQSTSAESTSAGLVSLDTTPAIVPTIDRRRRQGDRRGAGPTLRVPVGRLNELLRVVSEIVINRSTFEQHHLALIEQVDELKLSTARLRRVTHKLESDYEVRALGGNMSMIGPGTGRDAGSAGGHGFDDLEFDRYTEFHLLTRELTEITSDIATIGTRVGGTIGDFDSDLTRLGRLTRDIQDKAMEFRMVALGTMTAQLERAVRQTGEMCGKPVDFSLEGEHVSLDKSLLEQMSEPLLHLLRNAVDHGIESPEHRAFAAKPASGRITVRAFHEGTDVVIEVEDDGAGLDAERIKATAIARGLLDESTAAALGADALFALIFEPGFSTAERITEVSGRGVGMDVVKAKVTRLGGRVYLSSKPGAGTTVSVRVPMTLAITRILLVRSGGEVFGLPLASVIQIARPHPSALGKVGAERVCTLDGKTYPLWDLAETLGLPKSVETTASQPVLIANLSRRRIALAVDEIINSRDAVVKTLGTHLRRVPGIWGATLLGDGTVVLILNPADLAGSAESPVVVRRPVAVSREREPYHVLVVDDSLSMRHVLSVAVKKAGWVPVPARDGLEALDLLQRHPHPPDLVLLDIEMPRMDGFEFLSTVRSQKGRADLPIVMLTSRSGEKHRDKAGALGATDYMVKPFQEDALIRNIARLIQASRLTARRAS
jgi:chemosensory pili system protein ChpA (sensor histidine kinase/response regulator)